MLRISEAESQVMEIVWRDGAAGAETIIRELGEPNGWADTTTRTLITRLLRKKALASSRDGGRVIYRPLIARSDYVRAESQSLLDRLFDGGVGPFVAQFAENKALTPRDIEIMKRLLEGIEDDQ
jgi:BlaI family penicillinase repressor